MHVHKQKSLCEVKVNSLTLQDQGKLKAREFFCFIQSYLLLFISFKIYLDTDFISMRYNTYIQPAIPRIELIIATVSIPRVYNLLLESQFKREIRFDPKLNYLFFALHYNLFLKLQQALST